HGRHCRRRQTARDARYRQSLEHLSDCGARQAHAREAERPDHGRHRGRQVRGRPYCAAVRGGTRDVPQCSHQNALTATIEPPVPLRKEDVKAPETESPPAPRHFRHFFRGWLRDPRSMGAVAPSGRALARLIATGVTSNSTVLELGAGTGSLTEALLAKGVQPANLYLVERDPELAAVLRKRFAGCHVFAADALAL